MILAGPIHLVLYLGMSDNTAHNEVKPKTENLDDSPISLKVKDQSGEVVFKVRALLSSTEYI
jgi:plasmid replication initiation protein